MIDREFDLWPYEADKDFADVDARHNEMERRPGETIVIMAHEELRRLVAHANRMAQEAMDYRRLWQNERRLNVVLFLALLMAVGALVYGALR